MTIIRVVLTLVLAAAMTLLGAQSGYDLFQQGLALERAEADLPGAIAVYEQIVQASDTDRKLAAQALYRIGECQRALGNAEARQAYERILSEYSDQGEVVADAQARLAAMRALPVTAKLSYRQVRTDKVVSPEGTVSWDGRYGSAPDWDTGNVSLVDFVTGTVRPLTNKGEFAYNTGFAQDTAISRDGQQVAYGWFLNETDRYELRTIGVSGSDEPRRLYDSNDVVWIAPYDWSPDGEWIAVQIKRTDQSALIGLVSVDNGSLKVLRQLESDVAERVWFSPDGRYLAYDLPVGNDSAERDIFVLELDGGQETAAVVYPANEIAAGWAPDGRSLLFTSDRTGSLSLWSLPMADGKPQGEAAIIQHNLGRALSWGVTSTGAVYLGLRVGNVDIQVASVDFNTGRLLSPPTKPITDLVGFNTRPFWSADGSSLTFRRIRGVKGENRSVGILSLETDQVRELALNQVSQLVAALRLSPDGRFFVGHGSGGIFLIGAQSGEESPVSISERGTNPVWSGDGTKIYYRRPGPALIEHTLATGQEREIIARPGWTQLFDISPNGEWFAARRVDESDDTNTLMIFPASGGESRELFSGEGRIWFATWTADSSAIIIQQNGEFQRISVSNGAATRLDWDFGRDVAVHPDGRRIAYSTENGPAFEVWVLETLMPETRAGE